MRKSSAKYVILALVSLFSLALISACENRAGSESARLLDSTTALKPAPSGTYSSSCVNYRGQNHSIELEMTFRRKAVIAQVKYHEGYDCRDLIYQAELEGKHKMGEELRKDAGIYAIDYDVRVKRITLLSETHFDASNQKRECGFDNWELGVAKDVTGSKTCNQSMFIARYPYSAIKVGTGGIYLGDIEEGRDYPEGVGQSSAKRLTTCEQLYLRKVD